MGWGGVWGQAVIINLRLRGREARVMAVDLHVCELQLVLNQEKKEPQLVLDQEERKSRKRGKDEWGEEPFEPPLLGYFDIELLLISSDSDGEWCLVQPLPPSLPQFLLFSLSLGPSRPLSSLSSHSLSP